NAHPDRKPYEYIRGHLATTPPIEPHERDLLIREARKLTLWQPPERRYKHYAPSLAGDNGWTPTGDFNQRADWRDILEPFGWRLVRQSGQAAEWCRPGKYGRSISATTNYEGNNLFHCFSSSTGFEK